MAAICSASSPIMKVTTAMTKRITLELGTCNAPVVIVLYMAEMIANMIKAIEEGAKTRKGSKRMMIFRIIKMNRQPSRNNLILLLPLWRGWILMGTYFTL